MRSSTASLILAFCAMLVVQAAPMDAATNVARSVSGIEARGDFAIVAREDGYNAAGEEVDENGNVVDKRQNNKKNKKAKKAKARAESSYDEAGNEIDENGNLVERDDGYDAEGNEIDATGNLVERQNNKKNKKAKKARRDDGYDANGNEIDENGNLVDV